MLFSLLDSRDLYFVADVATCHNIILEARKNVSNIIVLSVNGHSAHMAAGPFLGSEL